MHTSSITVDNIDKQQSLADWHSVMRGLAIPVGLGGVGVAFALSFMSGKIDYFLSSYLTSLAFYLQITIGGLFFVLISFLTRAGWSVGMRRVAEVIAVAVIPMSLCALPIVFLVAIGNNILYPWVDLPSLGEAERHLLEKKVGYLNSSFFVVRYALYVLVWGGLALYFYRTSLAQDRSGDPNLTLKRERASTWGTFLFAGATTFFAFDFLMTLNPTWYSTIFGVVYFAGCNIACLAFLIVALMTLQSRGLLRGIVTVEHYHDLGKLLFGFGCFWAYVSFSQYFLIWYANIPEETQWYMLRQGGENTDNGWQYVSIALAFGVWVIPFVGMMSRHIKRDRNLLFFWACWILVFRYLDMYWVVMPERTRDAGPSLGMLPVDLANWIGLGGIFVGCLFMIGANRPIVAIRDPRLPESLRFKNI